MDLKVIPRGLLQVNSLRAAYPYQLQPNVCVPDYVAEGAGAFLSQLRDMKIDMAANCVYPRPLFVPHDQEIDEQEESNPYAPVTVDENQYRNLEFPKTVWKNYHVGGNLKAQFFRQSPHGYQSIAYVWTGTGSIPDANVLAECSFTNRGTGMRAQGFTALLSRAVLGSVSKTARAWYAVQFVVGDHLYSVLFGNNDLCSILRADEDGSLWGGNSTALSNNVKIGVSAEQATGNVSSTSGGRLAVEVLMINGGVEIAIGSSARTFRVPVEGWSTLANPTITAVRMAASQFSLFECDVHATKFHTEGVLRSARIPIGFSPQNEPYYTLYGASGAETRASGEPWAVAYPPGSTLTATQAGEPSDEEQRYELAIVNHHGNEYAGTAYADNTAICTRVNVNVDGIWVSGARQATHLIPKSFVRENIQFDPNSLCIGQRVEFDVDNWRGQWRGHSGNMAVTLWLGYQEPFTPLFPRFTGECPSYTFQRPAGNRSTLTFHCRDRMWMFDRPIAAPPPMDGWNHYYAVAFLAEFCGVTRSQMAFARLIPSDPFSAAPGDMQPYFLPFGSGMNPWTPRHDTMPVRQLLDYIRKPTGFMLYFDAQGYLRYERWIPELKAVTPKKVFTEHATGPDGANLSEFWNFRFSTSVESVRNSVYLIGVDPFATGWNPIPCKREDLPSIYAMPGQEPQNYVGRPAPFIWVDARFADVAFAHNSATRLLQLLRIPEWVVQFSCWLQPHLYPMDVIYLAETRTGAWGVPFHIMAMQNEWRVDGWCTSTITGRFLL